MLNSEAADLSLVFRDVRVRAAFAAFAFFTCLSGGAKAQTLDPFNPNAANRVKAIVVQSDGKILIGGDFTSLSPNGGSAVTRRGIARLNPDGTVDAAFDPNTPNLSFVSSIALQADGKVLVGGQFQ